LVLVLVLELALGEWGKTSLCAKARTSDVPGSTARPFLLAMDPANDDDEMLRECD
jgi:hypothetical protein